MPLGSTRVGVANLQLNLLLGVGAILCFVAEATRRAWKCQRWAREVWCGPACQAMASLWLMANLIADSGCTSYA